jgi:hypothetical protein
MLLVPYAVTKTEWPGPIAAQYISQVRWTIPSSQGTCPPRHLIACEKGHNNVVAMGPDSGGADHRGEAVLYVEVTGRTADV